MIEIKFRQCDISNRDHEGEIVTRVIPVVFDHDQEDGKSKLMPYFVNQTIELCDNCYNTMLNERRFIYAYGAMGYNTYTL